MEAVYRLPAVQAVLVRRRRHRARYLLSKVRCHPGMTILDVGCGVDGDSLETVLPSDYDITGIDLEDPSNVRIPHPRFRYIQQDARDMSRFADRSFDLAVSVGMMEHICDRTALTQILREIRRVARQYVIVVPWRYAWLEPHFKLPFFQLYPLWAQRRLIGFFDMQDLGDAARNDPRRFEIEFRRQYQWLSNAEWERLCPGARIYLNPTLESISIVKS